MRKLLLPKSQFSRNIATLVSGTALAQAIPLLLTPILAYLFTPEDFGLFGLYMSIVGFFAVMVNGRYDLAIILPEKDADAMHLISLTGRINLLITLMVLAAVAFAGSHIAAWFKSPQLEPWLWALPLSTLGYGWYQSLHFWANRSGKYKRLAGSRILRAGVTSGSSIGWFYTPLQKGGLIIGDVLGQLLATLLLFFQCWPGMRPLWKETSAPGRKKIARRYQQFPTFNLPGALLERSTAQLPFWLFTPFYGPAVVGFYAMAQRIIGAPGGVIARAFADVFREKASKMYLEKGECNTFFLATARRLLWIAVLPFGVFFFTAPWLFTAVFGEEWRLAGVYAQILTPMFFFQFLANPLGIMFLVAEKQKYGLYLQLLLFAGSLTAILTGYHIYQDEKLTLMLVTGVYTFKYGLEIGMAWRFSKGKRKR